MQFSSAGCLRRLQASCGSRVMPTKDMSHPHESLFSLRHTHAKLRVIQVVLRAHNTLDEDKGVRTALRLPSVELQNTLTP